MKIAYVSFCDIIHYSDRWSGTTYHIAQCLKNQSIDVENVVIKEKFPLSLTAKRIAYKYLLKKNYLKDREPSVIKSYARQINKALSHHDFDLILCAEKITPLAFLNCKKPIVFLGDAPFSGLAEYYPAYSNLCKETFRKGNMIEKLALEKCELVIYSSEWAAKKAIEDYNLSPSKVKVIEFGANIDCKRNPEDIKRIISSRPKDKCNLLFIGTDWFRKGGNMALDVAKRLNSRGLSTELTIVGCYPPDKEKIPCFVKTLGFIDKSNKEGRELIDRLFSDSHFFILPTRAECAAMVIAEANSFGTPALSTKTGGMSTLIKDDINGKLFSIDAGADEYCDYILKTFSNPEKYRKLAMSSFNEYQKRLNWDVAGKRIKKLLSDIILNGTKND